MSGKGAGRRKKDEDDDLPQPRRPIIKQRIVPLEEILTAVSDVIELSKQWPLILDDKHSSAAMFFRFRDTMHLSLANSLDFDPDTIRVKLTLAIARGIPLLIDLKKSQENLTKFFAVVEDGLFEKILNFSILDEYKTLYRAEDAEHLDLPENEFVLKPGFQVIITTQVENPPAILLDNCAVISLPPYRTTRPPPMLTDLKNPAGLEKKGKRKGKGKGKGKRRF